MNLKVFIIVVCLYLTINCQNIHSHKIQTACNNKIHVSMADSNINLITNYQLFEVSDYPEDVIMNLNQVNNKYRYKDSAGIICLPILSNDSVYRLRKFVMVKDGYVFTVYFLKNIQHDTILNAIRL